MPKVILVNPALTTMGYSFIAPRWLFVLARATPVDLVGDPVIVDESITPFDPEILGRGDIVGIGISSGNCTAGYRVLKEAKAKGATVIMGGIHATIFPDEPLDMGADSVVTGNGDLIWREVIKDALDNRLQKKYAGGRVPGDSLLKARWDLIDPGKYMLASIQTVAGCPENCSFCSVWVTDGRRPRQRLTDKIIEEANELYDMGFRFIFFADDNFNPSTLGRIEREPSQQKKDEFERLREERLRLFDEYDRRVPKDLIAWTQMTSEVLSDPEYLSAMCKKMRIRAALVGVESFSQEGLETANKLWNPVGQKMIETIREIQENGIFVLSSIICGLESDSIQSIETMREFALESGAAMAQFTIYNPYPGTKDYHEMMADRKNLDRPGYVPKHKTEILHDRFWLTFQKPADIIKHPNMTREELIRENKRCWDAFYSSKEVFKRATRGIGKRWSPAARISYIMLCFIFKRIYSENGISADSVKRRKAGFITRFLVRIALGFYSRFFQKKKLRPKAPPIKSPSDGARLDESAALMSQGREVIEPQR
ncbi:MAG: radical SAM protein [Blastocatellia bacterium]|nr:radical SAM protein [Blastocatellia bacterium]